MTEKRTVCHEDGSVSFLSQWRDLSGEVHDAEWHCHLWRAPARLIVSLTVQERTAVYRHLHRGCPEYVRQLVELGACEEALSWCCMHDTLASAWEDCQRGQWMDLVIAMLDLPPNSEMHSGNPGLVPDEGSDAYRARVIRANYACPTVEQLQAAYQAGRRLG